MVSGAAPWNSCGRCTLVTVRGACWRLLRAFFSFSGMATLQFWVGVEG